MTTLYILKCAALGLAAIIAWGLLCIAIWGVPKTSKRQAEELAEQAEALRADQCGKEDATIAEIEKSLPGLRAELDRLRLESPTKSSVDERVRIRMAIYDGERSLEFLRRRRIFDPTDRRQSAATFLEGRM